MVHVQYPRKHAEQANVHSAFVVEHVEYDTKHVYNTKSEARR